MMRYKLGYLHPVSIDKFILLQAKLFNIRMNYKQHRFFIYATFMVSVVIFAAMTLIHPIYFVIAGDAWKINVLNLLTNSGTFLVKISFSVQLVLACLTVQRRFKALNVHLKASQPQVTKANWKLSSYGCSEHLKIRKVYFKLCDCIDVINETFTFHMIFLFAVFLVREF